MATGEAVGLDEMSWKQLNKLMEALKISGDGVETLTQVRNRIREVITDAKNTTTWSPGEAFTVVSKAKKVYDEKREKLLESYTKCKWILTEAHKEVPLLLQKLDLEKHIDHLKKSEYFLLVTGETSAGKSSLINLLLGLEILPSAHEKMTSTIWEIKYGDEPRIKAHFESKDRSETGQPTEEIFIAEGPSNLEQKYFVEQISSFVRENASFCKKIELFWPHSLLQQGIVIVDTPGVGESHDLDDTVYQYLPEAFAFIFVLTVANADGINNDTIRKLFETVKKVFYVSNEETGENSATTFPIKEGMYGSEMPQEFLLTKCSLFVSNKWDGVPEKEVQRVEDRCIAKLEEIWPGFDCKSQLICMSVGDAKIAQQHQVVTKEFDSLMNGLEGLVTKCVNARLELNWRWLNDVLSAMITETKTLDKTFSSKCKNVKEGIKKLKDALEHIENHKEEKMEELYRRFEIFERNALHRVCKHLSSEEVNAQFSSWTKQEVPPEYSDWEKTKRSIEKAFNSRLQETLQLWLKNDMLLTKAEGFLHEELKKFFDLPEDQSNCLPDDKEGDSPEINSHYRMQGHSGYEVLLLSSMYALLTPIAWVFNPIASLAIRVGVAAIPFTLAALGLSAEGFLRLEARSAKSEFQQNKEAFMSKHSKDFLVFVEEKQVPQKYVKMQLTPVRQLIFKAGTNLSTLIPVERKQLSEFESEKRSLEKVQNALKRIDEEGRRLRGLHALQGMKEMCPGIQISREALEWNDRISSRIGSGTFGDVYEGKMWITQKESKTVALKVCKKELNDENASEIMDEIEMLRKLNGHGHIVQFHGISFHQKNVALIFEKCTGSLAGKIFKTSVPKSTKFQWAREIIDGLAFIHAGEVVHRDLKPENILLSEENRIKIADVGLAKRVEDITGTVAGTYFYMAPEVFDSKNYDKKADIYSLGIVLWEMWYGRRAYRWSGKVQQFFDWLKKGNRPEHEGSSDEPPWKGMMMKCWDGNPETRPTAWDCKDEIESVCMIQMKVV